MYFFEMIQNWEYTKLLVFLSEQFLLLSFYDKSFGFLVMDILSFHSVSKKWFFHSKQLLLLLFCDRSLRFQVMALRSSQFWLSFKQIVFSFLTMLIIISLWLEPWLPSYVCSQFCLSFKINFKNFYFYHYMTINNFQYYNFIVIGSWF